MKIVIVGGHLSPALAVIDALPKDTKVLFIGRKYTFEGDRAFSLEYKTILSLKISFAPITTGRLQRKFTKYTIISLFKFPYGFIQSFFLLLNFNPDVVLGFGGYVSLPVMLAAFFLRMPIVIHEQTLEAGLSNRIIAFFAKKVCISWESSRKFFPQEKTVLTGNPIRQFRIKNLELRIKGENQNLPIIYITGGSSGSHFINVLVEDCIKKLLEKFTIIHQTGDAQEYRDFGHLKILAGTLSPQFRSRYILKKFIDPKDVGLVLQNADLVVSRSGISTITELLFFEKPSLLIPLAFSQNSEQIKNALFFKRQGLGEFVTEDPLDSNKFLQLILEMFNNISKYKKIPTKNNFVNKNAAQKIIEVVEYAKKNKKE